MEKGNETSLKKQINRCTSCSRKKTAQMIPNFIRRNRGLDGSIEDAMQGAYGEGQTKKVDLGGSGSQSSDGSKATDVAVAAAAGTTAAATAPAAAKNLSSRLFPWLGRAGRFVLPAAAVAAPATGAYMGANYIEELITSALAGSSKINPAIANDAGSLQAASINLNTLNKIIGRMQGMASHVDNKGIALAAAIGATQDRLQKQQIAIMKSMTPKGSQR